MSTESLVLRAPAKINLFLQILGRREDGYHEIHSLVQAVNLFDRLTIKKSAAGISLNCTDPSIPNDDSNIVVKAARLVYQEFGWAGGVEIHLEKNIPHGAGLGGGSSDAAATIKGINRLFELGLDQSTMLQLGARLGSDVPLFFSSGSALIEGRGERVREIGLPLDYGVLLVIPGIKVSTAEAYAKVRFFLTKFSIKSLIDDEVSGVDLFAKLNRIGNDFQPLIYSTYPELSECDRLMQKGGARHVALTGSGSALFGLFDRPPGAELATFITGRFAGWQVLSLSPVRIPQE